MIQAKDNCYPPTPVLKSKKNESVPSYSKDADVRNLRLRLGDFRAKEGNRLISLLVDEDKRNLKNSDDELIVEITKSNDERGLLIQTGNYLGKFCYGGGEFDIRSRFGDAFLKRMLNFANDVYLDDVDVFGERGANLDPSRFILYYLFVQSLEKAYLLGLPKAYQSVLHHEMQLKGRLDINRHIRHDIPFVGKISSVSRELGEVQKIVDVLHKAITLIEADGNGITNNIAHIKPHLREVKSDNFVSRQVILAAQSSKALLNPIFAPYKNVLRYAEYIIRLHSMEESAHQSKEPYFGFLVNVAELFEIYLTKLLQKNFPEWSVSSPKIKLYDTMFYARKIIPDIVMQRGNEIVVFDTKYKRMAYRGNDKFGMGDVDRSDFFQINTYMSYYQQQGMRLLGGGLLYPLSGELNADICHSDNWLGNSRLKFIVDGIRGGNDLKGLLEQEKQFIERVGALLVGY